MRKFIYALAIVAATLVCGCNKENSGNGGGSGEGTGMTWTALVKEYPFLSEFPSFDGEVENHQYRELSGMKTVTFFDYSCGESVATTYYAKFIPAGFTKSDGAEIYRKTVGKTVYAFTGSYGGGNFGLSFSADPQ